MLFKNTKPLKKSAKWLSGTAADLAALRALAGLHCSVCDQPLRQEDHKDNWGYKRKHSAYTCCGVAHCPYCGASAKENCPHLVASRASGGWHLYGLPEVKGMPLPNPAPLMPDNLLAHSDAQKKAAFGAAYALLEAMFNFKWNGKPIENIPPYLLVTKLLMPDNQQEVHTPNGTTNQYYFSQNPAGIAERFEDALVRDLPDAFTQLAKQPIENTEHLHFAFAVETSESFDPVSFVGYSPSGKQLIVLTGTCGEIWDVANDIPVRRVHFCTDSGAQNLRYVAAAFSSSGDTVELFRTRDGYTYSTESPLVEIRSLSDGSLLSSETISGKLAAPYSFPSSRIRKAAIHQGSTVITTLTNKIRLHRLSDQGKKVGNICIALRRPVVHLAVFGSNDTFVTASDRFVCFWRVPQEVVQKPATRQKRNG